MLKHPIHNGNEEPNKNITGDKFFFPHPIYRQGLLVTMSNLTILQYVRSAFNFPIKVGEEVTLKFTEAG